MYHSALGLIVIKREYDGNALGPFAFGKSLVDKALHDRIQVTTLWPFVFGFAYEYTR